MEILDKRGSVCAVFIDYRKAFDIVNHNTLLGRLKKYNIPHCLLKWFGSYYNTDFVIDPSEVELRLAKINIYKAPGPDGIPNWLLRDFSQLLCYSLAAIFNASL